MKGIERQQVEGFSGTTGLAVGLGIPLTMAADTGSMLTTLSNNNMNAMTTMCLGIGNNQCRPPPAYKVAAQMARLHRLGRAHSHEGVTYRTDHEDGTLEMIQTIIFNLIRHVCLRFDFFLYFFL